MLVIMVCARVEGFRNIDGMEERSSTYSRYVEIVKDCEIRFWLSFLPSVSHHYCGTCQ